MVSSLFLSFIFIFLFSGLYSCTQSFAEILSSWRSLRLGAALLYLFHSLTTATTENFKYTVLLNECKSISIFLIIYRGLSCDSNSLEAFILHAYSIYFAFLLQ